MNALDEVAKLHPYVTASTFFFSKLECSLLKTVDLSGVRPCDEFSDRFV